MAVFAYAYGVNQYGAGRYGGDHPAVLIASVESRGIPFITGNDRYQIVCCDDTGTTNSPPSFRYWYAGPPLWDEELTDDSALPPFYALDENGVAPLGVVETTFESVRLYRSTVVHDAVIAGVMVEFIPMPATIEDITADIEFTVQVEGYGLQEYVRADGSYTTGMVRSDTFSFSESQAVQSSDPWPNTRTVFCPLRLGVRIATGRVLVTGISLCEIASLRLVGTVEESRTA